MITTGTAGIQSGIVAQLPMDRGADAHDKTEEWIGAYCRPNAARTASSGLTR